MKSWIFFWFTGNINETMTDEAIQTHYGKDTVMATARRNNGVVEYKLSDFPVAEKLEKFMEDVKYGEFPNRPISRVFSMF